MKKKFLSLLLVLMMLVGMISSTTLATSAASGTAIGVIYKAEGFEYRSAVNGYYPNVEEVTVKLDSGKSVSADSSCSNGPLFADADYTLRLTTEPELDKTYYFYFRLEALNLDQNITNANSIINVSGFYNGKILSVVTNSDGDIVVHCSAVHGELTGGVNAYAYNGVRYDHESDSYIPNFTVLKSVSVSGKVLDRIKIPNSSGTSYYSYYGATAGALYKSYSYGSFDDKLTTDPVAGETYYSYILLDSIDGNLHIEKDLVNIQIPGYDVEYIQSYESDMGFTSQVCYSLTYNDYGVHVGGVGMKNGDYLAVGSTVTTTSKPSGGYAYYNNGTLTLNNYEYKGEGGAESGLYPSTAALHTAKDIILELKGTNTLTNTAADGLGVSAKKSLKFVGDSSGVLNISSSKHGLYTGENIFVSGGTVNIVSKNNVGIYVSGKITVTDGTVNIDSEDHGIVTFDEMAISGGKVNIESRAIGIWVKGAKLDIAGGTVNIAAEDSGIYLMNTDDEENIVLISGGTLDIKGDSAIDIYGKGTIIFDDNLKVQASETVDGPLVEYVAENNDNYNRIVVASAVAYGDVNADGAVDAKDALLVLQSAVDKVTLTQEQMLAAEVDGQEGINAKDALEILKYAVQKITVFPIEK